MAETGNENLKLRITFGPFCLVPDERRLTKHGIPIDVGGRSFDLLVFLIERAGQVLSKRDLLKRVWPDVVVEDGSLRFHMANLRRHLGDGEGGARYITTQVGVGYAFVAQFERHGGASPLSLSAEGSDADTEPGDAQNAIGLPPSLPRLIGRESDVGFLAERLIATQLFNIVGPAGVGKTAVAIEIGHRLARAFDGQVAFVDLGLLESAEVVASMIADVLGISVQSADPLAVILGHIRDQRMLIVLDNCEHVIAATASIVERIMDQAPGTRILATSREPLRVRGEHVHRLEALGYPSDPKSLSLQELLHYPAVQLFCERASAAYSSLDINAESARLIAEMCHSLDGMALPIELAAVRVATHGIAATARQIGERFSLGWPGLRTARPRQQTLQATLDWSYDLLSDIEQHVLERLSLFVGPFSIDAALDIAVDPELGSDAVAVALDELTSKSLITPTHAPEANTYRLLEMTRAYARAKLRRRGADQYQVTAARHARFFLSELELAIEQGEGVLHDMAPLLLQLGNIRSALDWSFGAEGDSKVAVRLAAASAPVFLSLSHLTECQAWCTKALAEIDEDQRGTSTELELQGALGISMMFTRGNSPAAGTALSRALEIATELDDHWNQLCMLGRLHIYHERIGEYTEAMAHARRAVEIAEMIGEDEAVSVAYSLSGISHHLAGDQVRARHELQLALDKSPPSQRRQTIRYGFDHRNRSGIALARTLWLTGWPEQAEIIARRTVDEAAQLNHPVTHSIALIWSLAVYLWMGDHKAAQASLDAFAECAKVNALGPYIAATEGLRGELGVQQGETDVSLRALEDSLSRLRAARYELLTTSFSIALARGLIIREQYDEAGSVIDATIARCHRNGERYAMPELLCVKAQIIRLATADLPQSENLLHEAVELARKQGARAWELRAASELAQLQAIADHNRRARPRKVGDTGR